MGTRFQLILYASDSVQAQRAYTAVSVRMDTLNQVMSDYLDSSEINRLSATAGSGQWVPVSQDLFNVLQKAQAIARLSNGRFDPTIGALSLLWRRAVRRSEFPLARQRRQAHRTTGYRYMELDSTRRAVRLNRRGTRLDVGGIGQGFANDEALRLVRHLGIRRTLLDIGGDILVGEAPPDAGGWRISVPVTGDSTIILQNAAVTTSGDTYRFLTYRGRRYSHIMNPRSGLGLHHTVQVTVQAPYGYLADALTKVFSVANNRTRRLLIRRFPDCKVWVLEKKRSRLFG